MKLFGQSRLSNSIPSTIRDSNERRCPRLRPCLDLDSMPEDHTKVSLLPSFHLLPPPPCGLQNPKSLRDSSPTIRFSPLLPTNSSPIPRLAAETTHFTPLSWPYGDPLAVAQTLSLDAPLEG